MLNLFPIFGTPNDSISSEEFIGWKATQTPSYIQAQQDMIDDLFKKNYELKKENEKIKKENVELMERVNEIDNDVIRDLQDQLFTLKHDYAVLKAKFFKERDEHKAEVEKLKKDIEDYVFEKDDEIEKLKAQKHPMYPIHWGDYNKNIIEFVESEFNNGDPIESVYNLLKKAKDLTEGVEVDLDKSLDEQPKSTRGKVHMEFPNEVPHEWEAKPETFPNESQEEPAFLNCACGDCYEKTKQYNKFQDAYTECKITGYKIPKEKSWEEAASDLALRVAKLEEHIKYMPKVSFTK
jgi:hypothetical protein